MTAMPEAGPREPVVLDGRYRLQDPLEGTHVGTWRACDERLGRTVAVRLVGRHAARRPLPSSDAHPALLAVYDGGVEADGTRFLVTEFVEGPTAADVLAQGPLPGAAVARIGCPLAAALAALHARGTTHGDVAAANVVLPEHGDRVCVLGPAGGNATPADDVHALGVLLRDLLGGDPPSPGWAGLLHAMTADEPTDRPDAVDVAARLAGGVPTAPRRRSVVRWAVAFAGLGAARRAAERTAAA
ncbi:protein kinase family protein [Jatrophihabitans fulvus]